MARDEIQAIDRNGAVNTYFVEAGHDKSEPGSDPDDSIRVQHFYVTADQFAQLDDFLDGGFQDLGGNRLRIVVMTHNNSTTLSGKGLPEALIRYVHTKTGKAIESSPKSGGDDKFRTAKASAYWDRLVESEEASYDANLDVYVHPAQAAEPVHMSEPQLVTLCELCGLEHRPTTTVCDRCEHKLGTTPDWAALRAELPELKKRMALGLLALVGMVAANWMFLGGLEPSCSRLPSGGSCSVATGTSSSREGSTRPARRGERGGRRTPAPTCDPSPVPSVDMIQAVWIDEDGRTADRQDVRQKPSIRWCGHLRRPFQVG